MTSQGTDHGQLARAVERGDVATALAIAHDCGEVGLLGALGLVLLVAEKLPDRYPRYAARWHARWVLRAKPDLARSQLVLAALHAVPAPEGYRMLAAVLEGGGIGDRMLLDVVSRRLQGHRRTE